jgi:hypothetical protein
LIDGNLSQTAGLFLLLVMQFKNESEVCNMKVCISIGNGKMGKIPSTSFPPGTTCPHICPGCYATKLCRIYPNVRESYERNWKIWNEDPDEFFRQVKEAVAKNRFFRFHVSGDIPSPDYLERMVETANENPHCQILAFTKRYGFVNDFIRNGGEIPKNLHIIFSKWRGFPMENPYNLPEAHIRYKDGETTANDDAIECYGNCTDCSVAGCGCWKLEKGQQVVFNQH